MRYTPGIHWHAALFRAINQELKTDYLRFSLERQKDGFQVYLVESSRKDGSVYLVQLHQNTRHAHVICTCRSGKHGKPCKHAALVLYYAGVLTPNVAKESSQLEHQIAA